MYECFPKHYRIGTATMAQDKNTQQEVKKRRVKIEGSTAGRKKRSPDGLAITRAYFPRRSLFPEVVDELSI